MLKGKIDFRRPALLGGIFWYTRLRLIRPQREGAWATFATTLPKGASIAQLQLAALPFSAFRCQGTGQLSACLQLKAAFSLVISTAAVIASIQAHNQPTTHPIPTTATFPFSITSSKTQPIVNSGSVESRIGRSKVPIPQIESPCRASTSPTTIAMRPSTPEEYHFPRRPAQEPLL